MAFSSALAHSQVWTLVDKAQSRSDIGVLMSWSSSLPHVKSQIHKISRSWSCCSLPWCHSDRLEASSSSVCSPEWYNIRAWVLWVMVTVQGPCAQGSPSTCIGILELFRISWYQTTTQPQQSNQLPPNTATQPQQFKGAEITFYNCNTHSQPGQGETVSSTHRPPTTATKVCVLWHNKFLLSRRNIHLNCKLQLQIWFKQLSAWDSVLCIKNI